MRVYVFLNVFGVFFAAQLSRVKRYYFLMEYFKGVFNSAYSRIVITEFFEMRVVQGDRF